jgi:hypothetical protein
MVQVQPLMNVLVVGLHLRGLWQATPVVESISALPCWSLTAPGVPPIQG